MFLCFKGDHFGKAFCSDFWGVSLFHFFSLRGARNSAWVCNYGEFPIMSRHETMKRFLTLTFLEYSSSPVRLQKQPYAAHSFLLKTKQGSKMLLYHGICREKYRIRQKRSFTCNFSFIYKSLKCFYQDQFQ